MARVNLSFTQKYTAALDSKMKAQLADFANHSACAGILQNKNAAMKARVNHHGAFRTCVPARRFITAATMNVGDVAMANELKQAIREAVGRPTQRSVTKEEVAYRGGRQGDLTQTITRDVRGNVFGRGELGEQRGPQRVLYKIAQKLAQNQRTAISERAYAPGPTNGNNPAHNSPPVAKHKGFDWPLVDTGEMYSAIKGWVE